MMFCPKCKSIMMPTKQGNKTILLCKNCGHKNESAETKIKEEVKQKKKEDVAVAKSNEQILPEVDAQCPKCGNNKAYFWTMQTRGWDEPETQFYKCTKCGHSWRENA